MEKSRVKKAVSEKAFPPSRVIITHISPNLDNGRFAVKSALGHHQEINATIICDGHELLKADLVYRHQDDRKERRIAMEFLGNDTYHARLPVEKSGMYIYTVEAQIDRFASWRDGFIKKLDVGEATELDIDQGVHILHAILLDCAHKQDKGRGEKIAARVKEYDKSFPLGKEDGEELKELLADTQCENILRGVWNDPSKVRFEYDLPLNAEPIYAEFSSWYEFFPRSHWKGYTEGGTLKAAQSRLSYIASLGFDIVYLPPVHPIGKAYRKGKNNALQAEQGDVGSPWAIGGKEGGHNALHPDLGSMKDFTSFIKAAGKLDMKVAMDFAIQCSPDHPWVKEHPDWFKKRADGSIQYAENPPKKYQDIYPINFESADWEGLWNELRDTLFFWIAKGVKVFRVDNPHTKSFAFWEWVIAQVREKHPDVIFLAEAFTRPAIMDYLAKIGFNQSYTYFAWRHSKQEFVEYMNELTKTDQQYYFRPNFWPNTPDILTDTLQYGGRTAFMQRLILAATLSSNYGIYGPAFELMEHVAVSHGKEEYLDSEKYEVKNWDVQAPHTLAPLIKKINTLRRQHPALQANRNFTFHPTDNENLLAYSKQSDDGKDLILCVVNLDYGRKQAGMVDFQIHTFGISPGTPYHMRDILTDKTFEWIDWKNYVEIDPHIMPAHIFHVQTPATSSRSIE